jgi:nicotinamide-nucleotide amidase
MSASDDKEGGDPLAAALGDCLREKQLWAVTVESCTGGLLAAALTSVPGSSAWFDRGWVTYSNHAKHAMVGVQKEALESFGAVSQEVATAMALGALANAPRAGLAMATTGIAGPGGATPGKPVGLVWFGFARRTPNGILSYAEHRVFDGNRSWVRDASVQFALSQALRWLDGS